MLAGPHPVACAPMLTAALCLGTARYCWLSPWDKEPNTLEGRSLYQDISSSCSDTPLSCCVSERCDSSTGTAGVKELHSWCHQSHPSSAEVATASKPKLITNIAMNPTGNMGTGMGEPDLIREQDQKGGCTLFVLTNP